MRRDATFGETGGDEYLPEDERVGDDDAVRTSFRRETKIGLTVILGLLVVLGVVLALRLSSGNAKDEPAAIGNEANPGGERDKHRPPMTDEKKAHDRKSSGGPTIVAANSPPLKPLAEPNRWHFGSDPGKAGPAPSPAPRLGLYAGKAGTADSAVQSPAPMPGHGGPQDPFLSRGRHSLNGPAGERSPGLTGQTGPDSAPPLPRHHGNAGPGSQGDNPLRERFAGDLPASGPGSAESAPNRYPLYSGTPGSGRSSQLDGTIPRYGFAGVSDGGVGPRPVGTIPDAAPAPRRSGERGRRSDGTYKVQPNDSYWVVSEKLYGTGAYFKALAELNRDRNSRDDRLQVGTILLTPSNEELEKKYPDLCPKPGRHRPPAGRTSTVSTHAQHGHRRVYTVEEGDTLYDIARYELGKAARWAEIWELNREKIGDDCDYLAPGTALVLPDGDTPDALTRRPSPGGFRR